MNRFRYFFTFIFIYTISVNCLSAECILTDNRINFGTIYFNDKQAIGEILGRAEKEIRFAKDNNCSLLENKSSNAQVRLFSVNETPVITAIESPVPGISIRVLSNNAKNGPLVDNSSGVILLANGKIEHNFKEITQQPYTLIFEVFKSGDTKQKNVQTRMQWNGDIANMALVGHANTDDRGEKSKIIYETFKLNYTYLTQKENICSIGVDPSNYYTKNITFRPIDPSLIKVNHYFRDRLSFDIHLKNCQKARPKIQFNRLPSSHSSTNPNDFPLFTNGKYTGLSFQINNKDKNGTLMRDGEAIYIFGSHVDGEFNWPFEVSLIKRREKVETGPFEGKANITVTYP